MAKKLTFYTTAPTTESKKQSLATMSDITFTTDKTGDIEFMSANAAIKQALMNALNLQIGGNVLFPDKGAPLNSMLFNTNASTEDQRSALIAYINVNEPRVTINTVSINYTTNELNERAANITLNYTCKISDEPSTVTINVASSGK